MDHLTIYLAIHLKLYVLILIIIYWSCFRTLTCATNVNNYSSLSLIKKECSLMFFQQENFYLNKTETLAIERILRNCILLSLKRNSWLKFLYSFVANHIFVLLHYDVKVSIRPIMYTFLFDLFWEVGKNIGRKKDEIWKLSCYCNDDLQKCSEFLVVSEIMIVII